LPKGIDLSAYSQAKLNAVARRLNQRPGVDPVLWTLDP
jgi:IS30 family transposase